MQEDNPIAEESTQKWEGVYSEDTSASFMNNANPAKADSAIFSNGWWNKSPYTTWSSNGGPVNDYGGLGQPVSQGGIFVGSGGGTSRRNGSSASGNGAGGGGFGDAFDNYASASGAEGVYATYSVAVASTTDYIEITVGGGGGGGNKNYGQGDIKFGGNGASGAAQINLA